MSFIQICTLLMLASIGHLSCSHAFVMPFEVPKARLSEAYKFRFNNWMSASRGTSDNEISATSSNSRTRKKNVKSTTKPKQSSKHSVNDLAAKMGLKIVPPPKSKKFYEPKKHSNSNNLTRKPSLETQLHYARNGHAVLRKYVDPKQLRTIREEMVALRETQELSAWRQKVEVSGGANLAETCDTIHDCQRALEDLGIPSDNLPFLQYFNTWRENPNVYNLALEFAETAAILMDVPSVKLYQDSLFWKRSHDGPTPWHTDARMAPFDTPHMVTLWIPLQDISRQGSALQFVSKSHADFALPFWNAYTDDDHAGNPWNALESRYQHNAIVNYMPLVMGDLTVHSGWTLHCADPHSDNNSSNSNIPQDRLALAISYVDARAPIRPDVLSDQDHGDDEDQWSYADWAREVTPNQEFEHPLVPIVWPPSVP